MKRVIPLFSLFYIVLFSCTNPSSAIVIDLDRVENRCNVNLSDILEDISVVSIDSNIDFLFSTDSKVYVTSNYIVINNNKSLHLFNRQGEHIRRLSGQGNGPSEFLIIENFFIDEDILYYKDIKDQTKLFRINLQSSETLSPLSIDLTYLSEIVYANKQIYSCPSYSGYFDNVSKDVDSVVVAYSISVPSCEIEKHKGYHDYNFLMLGSTLTSYKNEIALINLGYSDTLFTLQKNNLNPLCVLTISNKMLDYTKGGKGIHLISANNKGIILAKMNFEYKAGGERIFFLYNPDYYVLYDRENTLNKISSINFMGGKILADEYIADYKNGSTKISSLFPVSTGKYGYIIIDPEYARDFPELMKQIANIPNNNDNPYIIVGEFR